MNYSDIDTKIQKNPNENGYVLGVENLEKVLMYEPNLSQDCLIKIERSMQFLELAEDSNGNIASDSNDEVAYAYKEEVKIE